ncbi:hypothetical protein VTN96DRAFT_3824 [Rasamsonia emersonii]
MPIIPPPRGIAALGRNGRTSTRNIAFLSIAGVITTTVLIFRTLQPGKKITTPDERWAMRGGNADPNSQTDQGTFKSAPRPRTAVSKNY